MFWVRKSWPRSGGAFLLILLLNCSGAPGGSGISNDEKNAFINTYVDLTLAKIKYGIRPREYNIALKNTFEKNGTSPEKLKEILNKISNKPKLQQDIYQAISNKLKNIENVPPDSLNKVFNSLLSQP